MNPPFPFVVGAQRSGTTLLRVMLDSHPDMAVPYESRFLYSLLHSYGDSDRLLWEPYVHFVTSHESFAYWDMHPNELHEALASVQPATLADALRSTYAAYASHHGKQRFADKTPHHALVMPRLAQLLPEARFVHVIRDGREVALALRDRRWKMSIPEAATYWERFLTKTRRYGQRVGPSRYLEVRYERLVADPEAQLRRVCDFIGIPFAAEMLDYPRRAAPIVAATKDPQSHAALLRPPVAGLRDWRRDMTTDEVRVFERGAGDTLAWLGYELGTTAAGGRLQGARDALQLLAARARLAIASLYRGLARGREAGGAATQERTRRVVRRAFGKIVLVRSR